MFLIWQEIEFHQFCLRLPPSTFRLGGRRLLARVLLEQGRVGVQEREQEQQEEQSGEENIKHQVATS